MSSGSRIDFVQEKTGKVYYSMTVNRSAKLLTDGIKCFQSMAEVLGFKDAQIVIYKLPESNIEKRLEEIEKILKLWHEDFRTIFGGKVGN